MHRTAISPLLAIKTLRMSRSEVTLMPPMVVENIGRGRLSGIAIDASKRGLVIDIVK